MGEVEDLKGQLQQLQIAQDYLKEDRRIIQQELFALKSKVEELNEINEKQEFELKSLRERLSTVDGTSKSNLNAIHELRDIVSTKDEKAKDADFQKKFGLPNTEYAITYYSCCDSSFRTGYLYITPNYLVWDSNILGTTTWKILIQDVDTLNKIKPIKLLPGKGATIILTTKKRETHEMRAFLSRKEAIQKIVAVGKLFGNQIRVLRDGVRDEKN
eukprot:TRINITY_DN19433_c0_g1_i1.p1 TRINITY_DN19433_c0_g1~~TRINITY_DN19433_c0_g1_i1.p1  ORF type:complete len:215 (-),score=27.28 TRINITY_DN19433_c0_g1_i1:35-679(-)